MLIIVETLRELRNIMLGYRIENTDHISHTKTLQQTKYNVGA